MPPVRIFFYRDGVSEGELETVKREEIQAITGGCSAVPTSSYADIYADAIDELWDQLRLDPSKKPRITFIVVGKGCGFNKLAFPEISLTCFIVLSIAIMFDFSLMNG